MAGDHKALRRNEYVTRFPREGHFIKSFGRFQAARKLYSRMQSMRPSEKICFHPTNREASGLFVSPGSETYFEGLPVEDCVRDLKQQGISQAFRLPERVVDRILSYAHGSRFRTDGGDEKRRIADLQVQRRSGEAMPARAICTDIMGSAEIMSILTDRNIHETAARYLGYRPKLCEVYLEVLFRATASEAEPGYQPFRYHYDIPGFGFIAFFFYLHAVDEHCGAHVMIRQSHTRKPLRLLLRSGQSAGELVNAYYDQTLELTVTGPKGHGFAEDLYSFHKVLRPVRNDRLSLQIRFY